MKKRGRVLIADDHPLFRYGISTLLGTSDFEIVAEVTTGEEAVAMAALVHASTYRLPF